MHFIASKMKHGIADHNIRRPIRERHLFDEAHLEVLFGQSGQEGCGKPAHVIDTGGIRVYGKNFTAFSKQMHQVAPVPASCVDHAHTGCDVTPRNLIEYVNIDSAELFLNG
jgi:hypothetical protein